MDKTKLEQVIALYGDGIYTFFLHLTGSVSRAEELYQDTFLKAIALDKIDFELNPKSYLLGIGINLWKNQRRKEFFRHKKAEIVSFHRDNSAAEIADDTDLYRDMEQKDTERAVRKAVAGLDDRHKSVVLLYYMQQLSVKEISRVLALPEGTVKTRLHKARQLLKNQLEDLI